MRRPLKHRIIVKLVIAITLIAIAATAWAGGRSGACPVTGIDMPPTLTSQSVK